MVRYTITILSALFVIELVVIDRVDAGETGIIFGEGNTLCSKYEQLSYDVHTTGPTADYYKYDAWIRGYLTAINVWATPDHDISGANGITSVYAWIHRYCTNNASSPLHLAMKDLIADLYNQQFRSVKR